MRSFLAILFCLTLLLANSSGANKKPFAGVWDFNVGKASSFTLELTQVGNHIEGYTQLSHTAATASTPFSLRRASPRLPDTLLRTSLTFTFAVATVMPLAKRRSPSRGTNSNGPSLDRLVLTTCRPHVFYVAHDSANVALLSRAHLRGHARRAKCNFARRLVPKCNLGTR
jgi:hypothetical protein